MKRLAALGALACATVIVASGLRTSASPELAKKEKVDCAVCHVKRGSKKLTDKGMYYRTLGTFEGYDKLIANFGRCTHCHKDRAGNKDLTKEGKRVKAVVKDMPGLFKWLKEGHTGSPD